MAEQAAALGRALEETVDWRHWMRRHPAALLGTALALGILIGRRRSHHPP